MAVGRYLLAWFPMVLIAVGNGAFRESILRPQVGELHARQLSTLLLIALFAVYVWIVVRVWPIESGRQAAVIGLAWLVFTLIFEFALDRFVSGLSWREIEITSPGGASGCSCRSGLRWRLTSFIACRCNHERRRDAAASKRGMHRLRPHRGRAAMRLGTSASPQSLKDGEILMRHETVYVTAAVAMFVLQSCGIGSKSSELLSMADEQRGRLLYETACVACHTTQAHWRDKRVVRSWSDLLGQVTRWQQNAGQNWGASEIVDVAAHLNDRFYKLPCPVAGCGGPQETSQAGR